MRIAEMKPWFAEIRTSLAAVTTLAVLLCGLYPGVVWALNHVLFPSRADGSLVIRDGEIRGSSLIAQRFVGPGYFHSRPSAAGDGWDASRSGGTNLGPLSKDLSEIVRRRVADYRAENGLPAGRLVPADAVTASASGLDPHISLKNALLQARRVARARGLTEEDVRALIEKRTEGRSLGILGEPRVNVLALNLALDGSRDERR
jgi:potassium-transporting ATPase KdpC subunit